MRWRLFTQPDQISAALGCIFYQRVENGSTKQKFKKANGDFQVPTRLRRFRVPPQNGFSPTALVTK